jgi:hypothetical protein
LGSDGWRRVRGIFECVLEAISHEHSRTRLGALNRQQRELLPRAKRGTYIPVVLLVGTGMLRCLLQSVVVVLGLVLGHVALATVYVVDAV